MNFFGRVAYCGGGVAMQLRSASANESPVMQIQFLDLHQVRIYLGGVEGLAREAAASTNPEVILSALAVLEIQSRTVAQLLREGAAR